MARSMKGYPPFRWDAQVDLVQIFPMLDYRRVAARMTMQEAVHRFDATPGDLRRCMSIDPVEPFHDGNHVISFISCLDVARYQSRPGYEPARSVRLGKH